MFDVCPLLFVVCVFVIGWLLLLMCLCFVCFVCVWRNVLLFLCVLFMCCVYVVVIEA